MISNGLFSAPPSEIILPLAGIFAQQTEYSLIVIILTASLGNFIGTTILYLIGWHYGLSPILSIRKWLISKKLISKLISRVIPSSKRLYMLSSQFTSKNSYLIGVIRCIPYIRSIISLPAGFAHMPFLKFLVYSLMGIIIWATCWQLMGYLLGEAWERTTSLIHLISIPILIIICVIIYRKFRSINLTKLYND